MIYKKTINGFPGYTVDTNGNVYGKRFNKPLKQYPTGRKGTKYKTVKLYDGKKGYDTKVHRLVLETFVGKCPGGMETCHNNGDKLDNRLTNLRWDTHSNNTKDAIKHGVHICTRFGENSANHKLTEQDVMGIWKLWNSMYTQRDIANIYGVGQVAISNIIIGKTWKHLWQK